MKSISRWWATKKYHDIADQTGDQHGAERDHDARRQHRRGDDDGEAEDDGRDDLAAERVAGRSQQRLGEHVFQNLRVNLDAGHVRLDRRRFDVEQTGRRGADQNEPAAKAVGRTRPLSTSAAETKRAGSRLLK